MLWSVFSKPWSALAGPELASVVSDLGFSGAEVPVRANSYVTPSNAGTLLPRFVEDLASRDLRVISIASDLDEPTFAACAAAGVPMIRVMARISDDGYRASVARMRESLELSAPWAEKYDVAVGVQPHHGRFVSSVLGVLELLDGLPEKHFRLVWDAAHDALAGDDPAVTLPLAAPRLGIVNLKNAVYRADPWRSWFVPGDQGMSDWAAIFAQLKIIGYTGPVCLCAEYSDPDRDLPALLWHDLTYAQNLAVTTSRVTFP